MDASSISLELIGSAAKIYRYSSPQQCTYEQALEYAGVPSVPRNFAVTEACKLRLMREINIVNAQHGGLPQFERTKEDYINRYKTIHDLIPLSVQIVKKHGRLLKMLGLPKLPPGSIIEPGRKRENLPSIYILNPKSGGKMGSTINNNLRRKAEAWTGERANAAAADDDEDFTLMDINDKESEEEGGRRALPSHRPRSASAARRSGTAAAAREARRSGTVAAGGRPQKGEYQAHHMVMKKDKHLYR